MAMRKRSEVRPKVKYDAGDALRSAVAAEGKAIVESTAAELPKGAKTLLSSTTTEADETKKQKVKELSEKLQTSLNEADLPKPAPTFKPPRSPKRKLRMDLAKIVETVWITDMHAVWLEVRKSLRVGEKRSQHGHLHRALDDARETSYNAHRLYVTAKREYDRWELENAVTHSAMWNEATRTLQREKDSKLRNKAITDSDVKAMAMTLFPDEYAKQESKRKRIELTIDNLKQLSKEANEHCEDLRVMLAKLRG